MKTYFKPTIESVEVEAIWVLSGTSDPNTGGSVISGPSTSGDAHEDAPRRRIF